MPVYPPRLQHPSGKTLNRERELAVIGLLRPLIAREFLSRVVKLSRLRALGLADLATEAEATAGRIRPPLVINNSVLHYWVEAPGVDLAEALDARDIAEAFPDLDYIGPVYRVPGTHGLSGLVCPVPNLVLIRGREGMERELDARLRELNLPLEELLDHSEVTRGWLRHYRLGSLDRTNAYQVREELLARHTDVIHSVHLKSIPIDKGILFVPNDGDDPAQFYQDQWNLKKINAEAAWDQGRGGPGTIVHVIDDGVDLDHPDLKANIPDPGINIGLPSQDGSYVDPDEDDHGTMVAGVAAARLNNSIGIAGLAGCCSIYPIKFDFSDAQFAMAVKHIADRAGPGMRLVINMSFGWNDVQLATTDIALMDDAIEIAHAQGCFMCAGTGNKQYPGDDPTRNYYPARHPHVLACGASDQNDKRLKTSYEQSHYGIVVHNGVTTGVSVVAPGEAIWSSIVGGAYNKLNGTSAAAPHVAALGALLMECYQLPAGEARAVIERTAVKINEGAAPKYTYADDPLFPNGRRHLEVGYGRIDAGQAMDFADVYIRDWPADTGLEPSAPPGGVYWAESDIVVRPADDNVFLPHQPLDSSWITKGQVNWIYVRVSNAGPAAARNVKVNVRITPYAGVAFTYPADWTLTDSTHVAPTSVTGIIPQVPAGGTAIARFSLTASQVDALWNWTQGQTWHPCILAEVDAVNDYAWKSASLDTPELLTRRNNLAQRNLTIVEAAAGDEVAVPIVIGHWLDEWLDLWLLLKRFPGEWPWQTELRLEPSNRQLDRILQREGVSRFRIGRIWTDAGKLVRGKTGQRNVELISPATRVAVEKVAGQVHEVHLVTRIPDDAKPGQTFRVNIMQEVGGRVAGGTTVLFVVAER